jgi:hypothetical protein
LRRDRFGVDNASVRVKRVRHGLLGALATLGLVAATWLPAEHIHTRSEDGHQVEYVHRHLEAHASGGQEHHVDHDDDATHLHGPTAIVEVIHHVSPHLSAIVLAVPDQPQRPGSRRVGHALFGSVHDPPWGKTSLLRGPPTSAV